MLSVKVNNGIPQADSGLRQVRGFGLGPAAFLGGSLANAWPTKHSGAGRYVGARADSGGR